MQSTPIVKDLVLIGGGHAHVEVLKRFAMRPEPGVRLTLVSRDVQTPYSGMLPGLIAGHYSFEQAHIDLGPLARLANARLIHAELTGLDLETKRIQIRNRPAIRYDIVSIDTGSAPDTSIPGADQYAIAVKPVTTFNARWDETRARILATTAELNIGVVGAGAGGIELLLAIREHVLRLEHNNGGAEKRLRFHLISASKTLLPTHNRLVQAKFEKLLRARHVNVHLNSRVNAVERGAVLTENGAVALDEIFWVTNASAPAWPAASGLAVDEHGFIAVEPSLQSISHPHVFAAGDVASVGEYPRPKSGVFAVRQGPPLSANLRHAVAGEAPRTFKPQSAFLSLISTGERYAIASRGAWALEGAWVWRLKDWIDRRFMQKYTNLPEMSVEQVPASNTQIGRELQNLQAEPMRCGGCGSKVGADILSAALGELSTTAHPDVIIGLDQPDDAAVVQTHPGTVLVQTIDSYRAFINDPYLFGRITANHCLSDIFAMGAEPQTALALVTLPLASPQVMRDELSQLMHGAISVFNDHGTALVGGHTNEGNELALGFAINGFIDAEQLQRKGGTEVGDCLILSKPIGSGILLAGDMRGKASTRDLETTLASMLQSNREAAAVFQDCAATSMTDITGFGLFGHLLEMLRAADVNAQVELGAIPVFPGALDLAAVGIRSSLRNDNATVLASIESSIAADDPQLALGFDPQTSGGLLASVAADKAAACVAKLHTCGFHASAIVGRICERSTSARGPRLTLS